METIYKLILAPFFLLCFFPAVSIAQQTVTDNKLISVKDIADVIGQLFKKKTDTTTITAAPKRSISILPSLGYNPSYGFVFGAKASIIRQFGDASTTDLSAAGLEAIYTTRGITSVQARHSVFTPENR